MKEKPDEFIDLSHCYVAGGQAQFDRSSLPGLRKALDHCHDVTKRLIRANDELREKIVYLEKRDTVKSIMLWISGTAAAALWAVLLVFGDKLLNCVMR